jgi:hypothetical protein
MRCSYGECAVQDRQCVRCALQLLQDATAAVHVQVPVVAALLVRLRPSLLRLLACRCRHCRDLLGELPVAHVAASCKSDEASTWLRLYASARMLDRLHWSQAAPHASKLTLISHTSHTSKHAAAATFQDSRSTPADAAALLARTGHTATAAGRFLVLIGGDLRDGPTPEVSDVAVLDLPNSRVTQPRLHGQQPPSLREHCAVLLQQQAGSALNQQVSRPLNAAGPC